MDQFDFITFYKNFAKGNQSAIIISTTREIDGVIVNDYTLRPVERDYYWQDDNVYNIIDLEINNNLGALREAICDSDPVSYNKKLEELIYGEAGLVAHLAPLQLAYNKAMNEYTLAITTVLRANVIAEDGSIDVDNLENEGLKPDKVLIYRQGATRPEIEHRGVEILKALKDTADSIYATILLTTQRFVEAQAEANRFPTI